MTTFSYYLEMAKRVRPLKAAPKVWNYIKFKQCKRQTCMCVRRYTPQIGSLLVTMRCNLNCGYCNIARMLSEAKGQWRDYEATLEKVQRIFENPLFADCILVDLLGGEPLLVDDFDRIVAYLSRRGHLINTSTNGILLSKRIADLKRAGISRINVSIYEANRAVLERDLHGINRIFPVHVSYVLLRSQVEQKPEAIIETTRFARDAGCQSMRFWMYRPMGTAPNIGEIITDANPYFMELKRRMESALPGFCLWPAPVRVGKVEKLCPQLWQRIGCDALGNVGICCGVEDMLQGLNSNLFEGSPDDVFNHPTLVDMREKLLDIASEPPEICKTCNLLGEPGW